MSVLGKILVKLGLDSSDFQKGTRDAVRQTQDFVSKSENLFKKLLGFGTFGYTLKKAFDFTSESYVLAAQMRGVKNAFDNLNKPDLLNNLRNATQETMSDLELMQLSIQAKNFRLPLEQMATYLKFATERAKETGQSVDYLVNSIITGLGRESVLILDNLGISSKEIREEMAKGGNMAEATGRIIQREMGAGNAIVSANVDLTKQSTSAWTNAKTAIGKLSIIKNLGDWYHKASTAVANFATDVFTSTDAVGKNEKAIKDEALAVNTLISKITNINTTVEDRRVLLNKLAEIQPKIVEGLQAENIETGKLVSSAKEYNRELVARIALAQKQDIITSAVNNQIQSGANLMSKEAEIANYLLKLQGELATAEIERGYSFFDKTGSHRTKWEPISAEQRKKLIDDMTVINAGTDDWKSKLDKTYALLVKSNLSTEQLGGLSVKPILQLSSDYNEINKQLNDAGKEAEIAKKELEDYKKAFSTIFETQTPKEVEKQTESFKKLVSNIQKTEGEINSLRVDAQKNGYTEQSKKDIQDLEAELTGLTESYKVIKGKEWGAKIAVETDRDMLKKGVDGSVAYIESEISKKELAIKLTTSDAERVKLIKEIEQLKAVVNVKMGTDYQKGSESDLKSQLSAAEAEMSKLDTSTEARKQRMTELLTVVKNLNWQIENLPQNLPTTDKGKIEKEIADLKKLQDEISIGDGSDEAKAKAQNLFNAYQVEIDKANAKLKFRPQIEFPEGSIAAFNQEIANLKDGLDSLTEAERNAIIEQVALLEVQAEGANVGYMTGLEQAEMKLLAYTLALANANKEQKAYWQEMVKNQSESVQKMKEDGQMLLDYSGVVQSYIQNTFSAIGDCLVDLVSTGEADAALERILIKPLADAAVAMGSMMIALGVAALMLETLIENPWTAIAAGAALLVLGTVAGSLAQSSINKSTKGGGSSTSGGNTFTGGYSNSGLADVNSFSSKDSQQVIVLDTRVSGSDLMLVQSKEQNRKNR